VARPLVVDTTGFVAAIRQASAPFFEAVLSGRIWLSAIVACELYAGARSAQESRLLDRLVRGAIARERFLAPVGDDWIMAGRLLARRVRLQGALQPRDHLADVLIVVSAARIEGEIATANRGHFEAWAKMARRAGLDVIVGGVDVDPTRLTL